MASSNVRKRLLCSSAALFSLLVAFDTARADSTGNGVESVVVTGVNAAASEKKDAPNVIDVQSMQEIRALPDVSAAEALERIPGVSMESDSGEGRFVNIRGMDADLNGTTYDGVHLTASNQASPQGGGRAIAFDAFPAGILGGLQVVKSLTPEMDAEGLGGVVNILPRSIPVGKSTVLEGTLGTGIEPLRGTPVWQADVTAGTRFGLSQGDDRFSIIGSYSIYDDQRGIDDVEEDYQNDPTLPPKTYADLQNRYYKYHRTRQGFGGGLTFDLNDDTALFIRGLHAGYTELAFKHRLQLNGLGSNITNISPDGTISVSAANALINLTDSQETVGNDLIEFGGRTLIASLVTADAQGSWTRGTDKFGRGDSINFKDPNAIALNYNNSNAAYPSYQTTDGTALNNPANYTNFSGNNSLSAHIDTEWAGKANFSAPLSFFDDSGVLKFGGSIRQRERTATASSADFNNNSAGYSAFSGGANRIYYNGHYNIGPSPNYSALAALPQGAQVVDPTAYEDDSENVYAGYAQYSATFGMIDATGGLRVENTQATYRANIQDASTGTITPNTAKRDYTNLFPDLNLKYAVTDDFILHAAYSTAIARPGFNQISAAKNVDVVNDVVSQGNPDLKPTTANSFDLSAEYYLPEGGIASVGLFYKDFSDYIIPTVQRGVTNYPDPRLTGVPVEVDSFQNIGSAKVQGVEFNYRQKFEFLPEPLYGLGFEGNVTFVGSSGEIRTGEKHTLPQTSPINYNAGLFYEQGPFNLRIAASYVSRNLWSVGGSDASDLYSQGRFRLDFGGSYAVTDAISYYFDVKDISNTKLEFTQTPDKNYPVQREFYGPTYLAGIRINLDK
ncbi:MAG TPA: TonB-dependent receptor [Rhizomicrobium sp.]|jgi:TonB-dependent receptor